MNYIKKTMLLCIMGLATAFAQETISGVVTDDQGVALPGATILEVGTNNGVTTDFDGNFTITVGSGASIEVSFVGYASSVLDVSQGGSFTIALSAGNELTEVVVTGLGVAREKKSLGYSSQEIQGSEVSTVKVDNVVNSLSGKISGVQIKANNNFGGSANFLIRGNSSLTGNNQPLFVVDGIPVSNRLNNSSNQTRGSTGYDYGNAASDINPDDIESINVLKGSAASAIYGSRGANGVIVITTKKRKSWKIQNDLKL